ncbi:MAG: glycosyltransferase [Calothrix sp. CSU_2_0]|nr:glycosyltransferase [Calothrix sp. CSU_2_0]
MIKKKIVFLIRDLNCGGAQRQLVTLVKGIDNTRFDVAVIYFYPGGTLVQELQDNNCKVICLNKQGRWDISNFLWRLLNELKKINPDILHGYMGEANLLSILIKPFLPFTRIVWGIRCSKMNLDVYDWLSRFLSKVECFLFQFADLIIINSHAGKKDLLNFGFSEQKMVVVPNGIDTNRFQPDREAGIKVRSEWQVSSQQILIGLVGRLDPQKDHPNFLKAAALLCQEYDNIQFVCVGTGDSKYIEELQQISEDLAISNRVIWAGRRTDMRAVHNALDIAVSASGFGEGFGNTIGEAMACGVPCVVTDIGDSAWIVGDTGIVVPPHNCQALAAGCKHLIELNNDEKITIKQKARKKIVECFSVDKLVENTLSHCLQTLSI